MIEDSGSEDFSDSESWLPVSSTTENKAGLCQSLLCQLDSLTALLLSLLDSTNGSYISISGARLTKVVDT